MEKTVVELFAGVGGFRVGLNEVKLSRKGKVIENGLYDFVWANQWEPSTKIVQHAYQCYIKRFGESPNHSNQDISTVNKSSIPEHTLLVGGFPCQDYSVARSLSNEKGIQGKKGVLWWDIKDILNIKRPPFVLLENVDRLLKSPSKQRGRDFGIILRSFLDLDYAVEWRVINAADYGHPQRRKRVFIFAYHRNTTYYRKIKGIIKGKSEQDIIVDSGLFSSVFPVDSSLFMRETTISKTDYRTLVDLSDCFHFTFDTSGVMIENKILTGKANPKPSDKAMLRDYLEKNVTDNKYYLTDAKIEKFKILRNSKKIERTNKTTGITYYYSEGSMVFPDRLDAPARTMLTSEGSINRSTHVVNDLTTKSLRLLTPLETERLNEFPDGWTDTGMPERRRYFMMGNALVTGVVRKLGKEICKIIDDE